MATLNDAHLLQDLALEVVHKELRPVYRLSEERRAIQGVRGRAWNLELRRGRHNLAQAVIVRLLTPRGELAALGHPQYGSRVHELIGQGNTSRQINLLRLFILEALRLEPRIDKVTALDVAPSPGTRSTLDVRLEIKPKDATESITIGPFGIELGV
jgi:phage baseplate assembly protein W